MRRTLASLTALSCLFLAAGCGGEDASGTGAASSGSSRSGSDGASQPGKAQRIEVTFRGDSVTPSGDRVEVHAGAPVELVVTADRPGEIHVHSSPEQELEYDAGTTTLQLTIDQPGVVDVESHDLEKTIVQLEVR
jgi:hypothetical protein